MEEYLPLFRFWRVLKMKNGIGVQKTGLEYFDNRNRLKAGPSWVSPGLDKFINQFPLFQYSWFYIYGKNHFPSKITYF